jgi:hypothetical protein
VVAAAVELAAAAAAAVVAVAAVLCASVSFPLRLQKFVLQYG